jgi:myo-inositol-hexaphosphate 3-phosphohydrolase
VTFSSGEGVTCALTVAVVVEISDTVGADIVNVPVGVGFGVGVWVGSGSSLPPPQAVRKTAVNNKQLHLANNFFMLPKFCLNRNTFLGEAGQTYLLCPAFE